MNLLRRFRAPRVTDEDVAAVVRFYYLHPDPPRAAAVFAAMLDVGYASHDQAIQFPSIAWLFGRIAAREPLVREHVTRGLRRNRSESTPFGRMVLETMEVGEAAAEQLIAQPFGDASDVARLEAEFIVTGSLAPMLRIVDAFRLKEASRGMLEARLRRLATSSPADAASWRDVLEQDYHIVAQLEPPVVRTVSDCDLLLTIEKPFSVTEVGQPALARRDLSLDFDADDVEVISIKATAYSTLAEAMNQEQRIEDAIRAEAARCVDIRTRITLLELTAGFALPKFQIEDGLASLEAILALDPYRPDLVMLRHRFRTDPLGLDAIRGATSRSGDPADANA
jgi:hypothetical protein